MTTFHFMGCVEIKELLGKKAEDEQQLLDIIEESPIDSIYYHMHSYFLRHYYIAGAYPNDFATWAAIQVRDRVLGERLAEVTPSGEKDLDDLRGELIDIIEDHLSSLPIVPKIGSGQPFYFMQSKIIEVPAGISASNLKEFYEAMKVVDASAIYNHIFEARHRDRLKRSDFAIWLDIGIDRADVAVKIEQIDSYMYSLEGVRCKILEICREELENE